MRYPVQLVPQGAIPRDPDLKIRMQKAPPEITEVTKIITKIIEVPVDDSTGAFQFNPELVAGNWPNVNMQSSAPASPDYFVETVIFVRDNGVDTTHFAGALMGRAGAGTGYLSIGMEWEITGNGDGTFDINPKWNGTADPDAATGGTGNNYTTQPNDAEYTLRAEFDGMLVRGYLNGALQFTVTRGGTTFDATGTALWAFKYFSLSNGDASNNFEVRRLRCGDLNSDTIYVDDKLTGTGSMSGRTPDVVGDPWTNYFDSDLPFSNNTSPDDALVGCVLT